MELDDIAKQVAIILVKSINIESSIYYDELAKRTVPQIHPFYVLPKKLDKVNELCRELRLPILSAKVINQETGKAGPGFYEYCCKHFPDSKDKDPDIVEKEEREKIRLWDDWQPLLDYLGIDDYIIKKSPKKKTDEVHVSSDEELINRISNLSLSADEQIKYKNQKKKKPELVDAPEVKKVHPRDVIVSKNALSLAKYKCEFNVSHQSFQRKTPPHLAYTEPHHLIPLSAYDDFMYSLDCEENICSLCSTCHNCVHYGKDDERDTILEKLYNDRQNMLKTVGLEITFEKLKSYY